MSQERMTSAAYRARLGLAADDAKVERRVRAADEAALQRVCVQWLELSKVAAVWFHVPAQRGTRTALEMCMLKGMGVRPGVADLVFLWGGGCAAVELKTATGRPSPAQRLFRRDCERLGIPYVLARSLDDLQAACRAWGLLRR